MAADETRELSLVGKVEMRIALADSDAKLTSTLGTYLPPLLLKLASEHVSVRNKVISICQHINLRVKPNTVQLPVAALIKQFKDQAAPLVRQLDIYYIQEGIDRLSSKDKTELFPFIVRGFASAGDHAPQIFNMLLKLLEHFPLPLRGSKEDLELRKTHTLSDNDTRDIADWFGKLILYTPPNKICPGLTDRDCEFLSLGFKPEVWMPSAGGLNILRTKILVLKLLSSGLFNDQERFFPAIYATADTASTVSDLGEDLLKRCLPSIDLEDGQIHAKLVDLYFGIHVAPEDENNVGQPRVALPLRIKILGLLNKSTESTKHSDKIIGIVKDGLLAQDTDSDVLMTNGMVGRAPPGRQILKLRSAVFELVNFVARYGDAQTLFEISPTLIADLREYIENQGWPKIGQNEDLSTRAFAYEVIGVLVKRGSPALIFEDEHPAADLLRWLFTSLACDTSGSSTIVSIEEALSTILGAVSRMTLNQLQQSILETLLTEQCILSEELKMNDRLRSTRYVAVRFANRCLPYSSVKARWIDLLAFSATDERIEVKEEAERGLSPYWYLMLKGVNGVQGDEKVNYPGFSAILAESFSGSPAADKTAVVQFLQESKPQTFSRLLVFARHLLRQEALRNSTHLPALSADWERNLDALVYNKQEARSILQQHIEALVAKEDIAIVLYQTALFRELLSSKTNQEPALVQHLALSPDVLVRRLVPLSTQLVPVILSNDHTARLAAAQTFGLLMAHVNTGEFDTELRLLAHKASSWNSAVGAEVNQVHGSVVALSYAISRRQHKGIRTAIDVVQEFLSALTTTMLKEAKDDAIREAIYIGLSQLAMFQALGTIHEEVFKAAVDKVFEYAKTGEESAITCLGELSMMFDKDSVILSHIESRLYELHEVRQAEVHFTVGEALACVAAGWQSTAQLTKFDMSGALPAGHDRTGQLSRIADKVIKECANTKPSMKKAAVMWLLCLVQFCGHMPEMQQKLGLCQAAFKRCLVDRDDLVQESASRGLGLVYEKGDRQLKDDLVRDLVSSFSSDKQTGLAGTVTADTQLFEPGALPTGDGSVSTYKDIMSLASEVGDSSLVYRFMSMASSNAIWSSRAAFGRFGLSNVLSDSSVDGYLANNPKLYPKLYRYRFDPNSGVRRSMNDIWNALVKDSSATIDKHFNAIIQDLLVSILGKEWRVRQASCAALADLLQGQPIDKYESYLEDVWNKCFKVLDDIKESVRAAAAQLARSLTGILTRSLESDHSANKTASAMLKHVLPFLLSPSGMESSAQEVQLFAIHTLLEIIKKSNGQTLRPFIPELVERLVGLLSTMEPEAVNYIHLNASKYNLTEQKIDDMRLSSVRSSPIMEAIERCLDLLDDDTMQELQPRLEHAMKTAVGLPSKVGASRVLVSLSTRRPQVFKSSADHFLKVIEKLILDRNETVASSYAVAAGYVARHATEKQFLRLATYANDLYFKAEGDREGSTPRKSLSSSELVYAIVKHANDRFNAVAASFLPLVYFAKHDTHAAVKEQFQNTWNEAVGGARAVQLYLKEILDLIVQNLDSPQWTLKHTAARSVADATTSISGTEKTIANDTAAALWPVIEKALNGKTWDGKEVVLEAFAKFVEHTKPFYENRPDVAAAIIKIIIREAKRNNVAYRQHALKALARVAAARDDVDISKQVREIIAPLIDELQGDDPMDVDVDATSTKSSTPKDLREQSLASAIECLFESVQPTQADLDQAFEAALAAAVKVQAPAAAVRRSTYQALKHLFERMASVSKGLHINVTQSSKYLGTLLFGPDAGSEALRLLRAEAVLRMYRATPSLGAALRGEVEKAVHEERSKQVLDLLAAGLAALA